jgi:protein gp37
MTKIEWTHRPGTMPAVLNPTTGCDKISPGCKFCYAEIMHRRLEAMGQPKYQQPFKGHVQYWPEELAKPFKWKKPRTVFLNSMSDIFHEDVPIEAIAEIYAMMFLTPEHTYIVLTKRADRAKDVLSSEEFFFEYVKACNRLHDKYNQPLESALYFEDEFKTMWPLKNVWQGVSVESQDYVQRVRELCLTPAHIRVVSAEPLLGPLDFNERVFQYRDGSVAFPYLKDSESTMLIDLIDWIIVGGESGHKARPMHPDWVRDIRDQCKKAKKNFFFKQWGEWVPAEENITSLEQIDALPDRPKEAKLVEMINRKGVHNNRLLIDGVTEPLVRMFKVGKHLSGNAIDGKKHLNFPV